MSEAEARFTVLRQSADANAVAAIERLVREAPDRALTRVNVLDFPAANRLDEERAIVAFLHAARMLGDRGLVPVARRRSLRGIADALTVYEIP